ncbi:hypothetical protein POM88_002626 [Heracleum sosnowskyi]|uniref:Formyl transferase N-terminal domain-containing protein n=1 Tax=Heracleum sosnowskyi TaxID=360622 RepID=A0AAD8NC57_9APIA|nr:hypothetical protein POM88_002626 [Heracleum sosnowskyi]
MKKVPLSPLESYANETRYFVHLYKNGSLQITTLSTPPECSPDKPLDEWNTTRQLCTTKDDKREEGILNLVQDTDFQVLARYMQVLSANFIKAYRKDVINIHHGLLPSFKGGNPSKQAFEAFEAGVKLIGATAHFVTKRT